MGKKLLFTLAILTFLMSLITGCDSKTSTAEPTATASPTPSNLEWKSPEPTGAVKLAQDIVALEKESLSFEAGNYEKGKIPPGEYIFISLGKSAQYYSEEDLGGSIIDNHNFPTFGYVSVLGAGNVTNRGCLISVNALERLGVSGAKQIYEMINNVSGYNQSGMYKVGVDIPEGTHTITSLGNDGYYAILSGPVGNNEIADNKIFNGSVTLDLTAGQYLELNRASIN